MSRITTLVTRYRDQQISFEELSGRLSTMPMKTKRKWSKTVEELMKNDGIEPLEEGTWEEVDQAVDNGLITPEEGRLLSSARCELQGHSSS